MEENYKCLFGPVNCGPQTALVGVNVVGEYCSVPGIIFASLIVFQVLHVVFRVLGLGAFSRSLFSTVFLF